MSARDLVNQLEVAIALGATFGTNTTLFTAVIDMSDFDPGFMFSMMALSYQDGTYVLTLQDSPDGSVFTDIPTNKLIDPGGVGSLTVDSQAATNDILGRIGAFSTDRFVRGKLVGTGVSGGSSVVVLVTKMGELVPIVT